MMRTLFLLAITPVMLANTIHVTHGPRLIQPRPTETGVSVTVKEDAAFLHADILTIDHLTLQAPITYSRGGMTVTMPAGTLLTNFFTLPSKKTDRVDLVYCGPTLAKLPGGKVNLPKDMSKKTASIYRLCFYSNPEKTNVHKVFAAGGKRTFAGVDDISPVSVVHSSEPRETGSSIFWELADVWGGSRPKAKMVLVLNNSGDRHGGQRIKWERPEAKGDTLWLTAVGTKETRLPHSVDALFGVYDITIESADTDANTMTYRVNRVLQPAQFIDLVGSYQMKTIYITY